MYICLSLTDSSLFHFFFSRTHSHSFPLSLSLSLSLCILSFLLPFSKSILYLCSFSSVSPIVFFLIYIYSSLSLSHLTLDRFLPDSQIDAQQVGEVTRHVIIFIQEGAESASQQQTEQSLGRPAQPGAH